MNYKEQMEQTKKLLSLTGFDESKKVIGAPALCIGNALEVQLRKMTAKVIKQQRVKKEMLNQLKVLEQRRAMLSEAEEQ